MFFFNLFSGCGRLGEKLFFNNKINMKNKVLLVSSAIVMIAFGALVSGCQQAAAPKMDDKKVMSQEGVSGSVKVTGASDKAGASGSATITAPEGKMMDKKMEDKGMMEKK